MAKVVNTTIARGARDLAKISDPTKISNRANSAARSSNKYAVAVKYDVFKDALEKIAKASSGGNYHVTLKVPYQKLPMLARKLVDKKYDVFRITPRKVSDSYLEVFWYGKKSKDKIFGRGKGTDDTIISNFIIDVLIPDDPKKLTDIEYLNEEMVCNLEKLVAGGNELDQLRGVLLANILNRP